MTETPVPGPVPRFELSEWLRLGVVAGITWRGSDEPPFDLGLGGKRTPVGLVMDRWRALQESYPGFEGMVISRQVHGVEVRWQGPARGLVIQYGADGHATDTPGLLLGVTAADCVPVYLADPIGRRVALVHAGWRGVAGGILPRGIALMEARGSVVENLLVHCGIGICGQCYQVGSEVFAGCGLSEPAGGGGLLDLRGVLVDQARRSGAIHISTSELCSKCHQERFFSHRGSGGGDGRMAAYIGLVPGAV